MQRLVALAETAKIAKVAKKEVVWWVVGLPEVVAGVPGRVRDEDLTRALIPCSAMARSL